MHLAGPAVWPLRNTDRLFSFEASKSTQLQFAFFILSTANLAPRFALFYLLSAKICTDLRMSSTWKPLMHVCNPHSPREVVRSERNQQDNCSTSCLVGYSCPVQLGQELSGESGRNHLSEIHHPSKVFMVLVLSVKTRVPGSNSASSQEYIRHTVKS
jgi:hypothetical protein